MLNQEISQLVSYGIRHGLCDESDRVYIINRLLELFLLEQYEEPQEQTDIMPLSEILSRMLDFAAAHGLMKGNGTVYRDLFDTKIMSVLTPRPSEVIKAFWEKYNQSPEEATNYYYYFSQSTNYIRTDRVIKDVKWKTETEYGTIDVTINLSKPEKDPKEIAAAKLIPQSGYPACLLCKESEGFAGNLNYPARQNHRIIPIMINQESWGFQYSPYVYYNEHCIVFNGKHTPMKIERKTFIKLFDFVKLFPHYFVGSNADLPIVGGSILSHDHFQGGNYEFAMAKAGFRKNFRIPGWDEVEAGIVHWPMSVIRLRSDNEQKLIELGDIILHAWRTYSDPDAFILAQTNGEEHNTITPIARKRNGVFELDLVLRNNITTEEHPLGVYHPHKELQHIKKENIGLIEVMGLEVLPARLREEMELLARVLSDRENLKNYKVLEKHMDWVLELESRYKNIYSENVNIILQDEIGKVFAKVLEQTAVFANTQEGKVFFDRFIQKVVCICTKEEGGIL